jgi:hypothetical protein
VRIFKPEIYYLVCQKRHKNRNYHTLFSISKWCGRVINHTIVELALGMMIACDVTKFLWHEAINHTTYIQDKSLTCAIKGKTPQEGFTGQQPNISHLQEFGSPVWVLNEASQSKLNDKSQKMIMMFMGFVDGPCAIKYYNSCTQHIGTMQNYHFADTPPDIQFEGEDDPEQLEQPTESQIEPSVKHHENLKRKCLNDIPPPIEEFTAS